MQEPLTSAANRPGLFRYMASLQFFESFAVFVAVDYYYYFGVGEIHTVGRPLIWNNFQSHRPFCSLVKRRHENAEGRH
jgi:hypothetical protein